MNIRDAIKIETNHSRLNDPATWHNIYRTCSIPENLKTACALKHDLEPKRTRFHIIKDRHKKQCYLLCFSSRQCYMNKGLGWIWYSTETVAKSKYGPLLIPA